MKKKLTIIFTIIVLLLLLFFIFKDKIFMKKAVISNSNLEVTIKYPSLSFKYNKDDKTITSKTSTITLNIKDDLDENTTYEIISDYKKMTYNGKEKKFSKNDGIYYYNSLEKRYEVIIKLNNKSYLEIDIKDKNDIDKAFNSKNIQDILQSIEIKD